MKAKLDIKFIEVSSQRATKKMMENKRFVKSTEKTVKKLCEQIDNYFSEFDIKTKTTYKIS